MRTRLWLFTRTDKRFPLDTAVEKQDADLLENVRQVTFSGLFGRPGAGTVRAE